MVRGLPDHYKHTVISRREIALELMQTLWYWTSYAEMPPLSYYEYDVDTMPADRRLVVEFFHPSTGSRRFRGWVDLRDVYGEDVYRFVGSYLYGETSKLIRYPMQANHTLRIRYENWDPYAIRRFWVAIEGYTEPA